MILIDKNTGKVRAEENMTAMYKIYTIMKPLILFIFGSASTFKLTPSMLV